MNSKLKQKTYQIISIIGDYIRKKMSRNMWILAVLISVLVIASIYREQSGMKMPDHLNCKESMFEQMFTDECTPRTGLKKLKQN